MMLANDAPAIFQKFSQLVGDARQALELAPAGGEDSQS
jgi:hypothetical protein